MTLEEAERLKEGDVVEAVFAGERRVCTVMCPRHWLAPLRCYERRGELGWRVCVRRVGLAKDGRPFAPRTKPIADVLRPRDLEPARANVYADWLEDHGEHRAAAMLREAFPLAAREGA